MADQQIIAILYGDPSCTNNYSGYHKLLKEVRGALEKDWRKTQIYYLVLGSKNKDLLVSCGAKHIDLVDKNSTVVTDPKMTHFYNKTYLLNYAMEKFDEILFVDFDVIDLKQPDDRMWELLRTKKKMPVFRRDFQCPLVGYTRPMCLEKKHGGKRDRFLHPVRMALNTCLLYCTNKSYLEEHLRYYELYQNFFKHRDIRLANDEHVLMHYLDQEYGVIDSEKMIDYFEPAIVDLDRSSRLARLEKKMENIYFRHY